VDGLLVSLAYDTKNLSHFDAFIRKKVPVIFFDRVMENDPCTHILIDNRKAAYELTRHLIEQGCKHIVHITAPLQQNVYIDRLNGFKQALREYKLKFCEDDVLIGNLSQEAGTEAAETILKMKPLPDGVFVANDNCAVSCMLAVKKAGYKIPDDIAFAGFNNDPVSQVVEPNLTTINYPGYEMGEVAARHLISHLSGDIHSHRTNTIVLRSELLVRASSLKKKQP
jgi:LacI family transcriptional regulator